MSRTNTPYCAGFCPSEAMDVAMVDADAPRHYWCHKCQIAIQPELPDFTCPTCKGDFIEEIEDTSVPRQQQQPNRSAAPQPQANVGQVPPFPFAFQQGYPPTMQPPPFPPGQLPFPQLFQSLFNAASHLAQQSNGQMHPSAQPGPFVHPMPRFYSVSMPAFVNMPNAVPPSSHPFASLIHQLLSNPDSVLGGPFGDANGSEFQRVLNQLFDASAGRYGPPPTSKSTREMLPDVSITESDVANKAECAVCKDEFSLGETTKQLPCSHRYHQHCIMPWLEQHNTCPICRFELPTDDPDWERRRRSQPQRGGVPRTSN